MSAAILIPLGLLGAVVWWASASSGDDDDAIPPPGDRDPLRPGDVGPPGTFEDLPTAFEQEFFSLEDPEQLAVGYCLNGQCGSVIARELAIEMGDRSLLNVSRELFTAAGLFEAALAAESDRLLAQQSNLFARVQACMVRQCVPEETAALVDLMEDLGFPALAAALFWRPFNAVGLMSAAAITPEELRIFGTERTMAA